MTADELFTLALRHYGTGLWLLLAVVAVELLNLLAFRKLNRLGIVPREPSSLIGILLAPFLHLNLKHFFANLAPLCVLAFLLGQLAPRHFWWIVAVIWAGSGALVWLLARRVNHVGASGLVYGLVGYLALSGFLSGNLAGVLVGIAVVAVYSGILWGVLPTAARTSWESHLAGLAVGLGLAWLRIT